MNCIDEAVKIEESFGVNVRGQALAILKKIADLENTTSLENIEEAWSDYGNDIIQDEFRPNNLKSLDDIEKILIKN